MAVPAHDERDFEFAQKFNIDIIQVIDDCGTAKKDAEGNLTQAFTASGPLKNSDSLNRMDSESAKKAVIENLEKANKGLVSEL